MLYASSSSLYPHMPVARPSLTRQVQQRGRPALVARAGLSPLITPMSPGGVVPPVTSTVSPGSAVPLLTDAAASHPALALMPAAAGALVAAAWAARRLPAHRTAQGSAALLGAMGGAMLPTAATHPGTALAAVTVAALVAPRVVAPMGRLALDARQARIVAELAPLALSVWALGCAASL